jgi:hypothetical protein
VSIDHGWIPWAARKKHQRMDTEEKQPLFTCKTDACDKALSASSVDEAVTSTPGELSRHHRWPSMDLARDCEGRKGRARVEVVVVL